VSSDCREEAGKRDEPKSEDDNDAGTSAVCPAALFASCFRYDITLTRLHGELFGASTTGLDGGGCVNAAQAPAVAVGEVCMLGATAAGIGRPRRFRTNRM